MKAIVRESANVILIILGILSAGFGLKGFLLSSRFIDGGVTGISMLLSDVLGFPLAILILVINLPFIALGYRQIGKKFAIKSALAIAGLAICLFVVKYPDVTPDKLLTAVFGGFFIKNLAQDSKHNSLWNLVGDKCVRVLFSSLRIVNFGLLFNILLNDR